MCYVFYWNLHFNVECMPFEYFSANFAIHKNKCRKPLTEVIECRRITCKDDHDAIQISKFQNELKRSSK